MAQTAELYETFDARLVTGRVLRAGENGGYRVGCGNRAFEAGLAPSCLLRPQKNDTVLLAELEDGTWLILAVLARSEDAEARLILPPESSLVCPGRLRLTAADSLELQSGRKMGLHTGELAVSAKNGAVRIAEIKAVSDVAEFCCRAFSSLGDTALSVFKSLTQCLGSSRRMVEGDDETRAANSTLIVAENATVISKNGLTLAEETARTDAKLSPLGRCGNLTMKMYNSIPP
jgi:hypothetical protein